MHRFGGGFKIKRVDSQSKLSKVQRCTSAKKFVNHQDKTALLKMLNDDMIKPKEQEIIQLYAEDSTDLPEQKQNYVAPFKFQPTLMNENKILNERGSKHLTKFFNQKQSDRPATALVKKVPVPDKQFDDAGIHKSQDDQLETIIKKYTRKHNPIKYRKKNNDSSLEQLEDVVDGLWNKTNIPTSKPNSAERVKPQEQQSNQHFNLAKRAFSQRIHARPITSVARSKPLITTPTPQKDDDQDCQGINRYQFLHPLGTGSYALVRLAKDKLTDKQVAIKTYQKSRLIDPQRKQNLKREIYILKKLDHPCIIKLLNTLDTQTEYHLIMENGGSTSLRQFLKQQTSRRISEKEAKLIFSQVVKAIDYCHANNVVHRDIKLENILLNEHMDIKLIDFGFSVIALPETRLSVYCGTPSYMSPELVSRQEYYGKPVDIWALGVLLYVLVSGRFPFRGADDRELFDMIKKGKYKSATASQECQRLINSILQPKSTDRPSTHKILQDSWFYQ